MHKLINLNNGMALSLRRRVLISTKQCGCQKKYNSIKPKQLYFHNVSFQNGRYSIPITFETVS